VKQPSELLPLTPPALLLDELLEANDTALRARGSVPAGSPFVVDGRVPVHIALEVAAQAAGAHGLLLQGADQPPAGEGYLVVLREVELRRESFAAGAPLDLFVELDGAAAPLGLYRFAVTSEGEALADGVLGVYVPLSP
jgi:predicted hotdog family 3-hydroxylacyl-ACP dehydratase